MKCADEASRLATALIGCGRHGAGTLIPALLRSPEFQVVACVDTDMGRAESAASAFSDAVALTHVGAVEWSIIDTVIAALPPSAAAGLVPQCITHRVHCFIEKPCGQSSSQLSAWAQDAKHARVIVRAGYNFRFAPAIVAFRDSLARLKCAHSILRVVFKSRHPASPEWGVPTTVAWIKHNGVHAIDLVYWLRGPIARCNVAATRLTENRLLLEVTVVHDSGSVSILEIGNCTDKFDLSIQIADDTHCVLIADLVEVALQSGHCGTSRTILYRDCSDEAKSDQRGYVNQFIDFAKDVRGNEVNCAPNLVEAASVLRIAEIIVELCHKKNLMQD
jgi:predicted dehydrogenase